MKTKFTKAEKEYLISFLTSEKEEAIESLMHKIPNFVIIATAKRIAMLISMIEKLKKL